MNGCAMWSGLMTHISTHNTISYDIGCKSVEQFDSNGSLITFSFIFVFPLPTPLDSVTAIGKTEIDIHVPWWHVMMCNHGIGSVHFSSISMVAWAISQVMNKLGLQPNRHLFTCSQYPGLILQEMIFILLHVKSVWQKDLFFIQAGSFTKADETHSTTV